MNGLEAHMSERDRVLVENASTAVEEVIRLISRPERDDEVVREGLRWRWRRRRLPQIVVELQLGVDRGFGVAVCTIRMPVVRAARTQDITSLRVSLNRSNARTERVGRWAMAETSAGIDLDVIEQVVARALDPHSIVATVALMSDQVVFGLREMRREGAICAEDGWQADQSEGWPPGFEANGSGGEDA